jgi:AraC-like DNA-binding protein
MILTKLPDIKTFRDEPPEPEDNIVLLVTSQSNYYYPEHKTPNMFIANFLSTGRYVANKRKIEVSEKYFYFLNHNDSLEIDFGENTSIQTLFILFKPQFINDCFTHLLQSDEQLLIDVPTVPFALNSDMRNKICLLTKAVQLKENIEIYLTELTTDIASGIGFTQIKMNNIQAVKRTTREEIYSRIFQAIEIMNDSMYEKKTLDTIAEAVYMNKFHFLAHFKSITGSTPHQYFTQIKLQKALDLLGSKQYSVSEVCFALGFESVGSFSNLFKRKFHVTPSKIPNFQ